MLLHQSAFTQYLQALFWAIVVTTGVGRDVVPHTEVETCFTIFVIVLGVILYAFILGSFSKSPPVICIKDECVAALCNERLRSIPAAKKS